MLTYQDLLEAEKDEKKLNTFVWSVINEHKSSDLYQTAILADEYDHRRNRTIREYQKLLYSVSGNQIQDQWSSNYKMASNFFDFIITQENQYLLGNGVIWEKDSTATRLGTNFNSQLQLLGKKALIGGVAFGYWNLDHMEIFGVDEFAPLYDETTGYLRAGVRFWRIDETKPMRATLYEPDGVTEYIRDDQGERVLEKKRPYIVHVTETDHDGVEISENGENYPTFPIVPLWGSLKKQSEIIGFRWDIDAYDLVKNGFANDLADAAQIYWILKNAGGMDDRDLAEFVQRIHTTRAVNLQDGVEADAHTQEVPYAAREALLTRLRDDIFEHAMAFDPKKLASGGSVVTASIKSAYVPLDEKTDEYEYCVEDFLRNILSIVGVEDENPTFTRSMLINETDQIQTIVSAANYLPQGYITEKILNILGDGDRTEEILAEMASEEQERMAYPQAMNNPANNPEEPPEDNNE